MYDSGALTLEAKDVMTPGVVTVSDDATLGEAVDAMADHRIHAVLVVDRESGTPLGWITARGLLARVGCDAELPAIDAIDEKPRCIEPEATLRAALYVLALPGVTRLLVRSRDGAEPVGVISDFDLTVKATRLSRHPA
jgi:CBS domain-containing protein